MTLILHLPIPILLPYSNFAIAEIFQSTSKRNELIAITCSTTGRCSLYSIYTLFLVRKQIAKIITNGKKKFVISSVFFARPLARLQTKIKYRRKINLCRSYTVWQTRQPENTLPINWVRYTSRGVWVGLKCCKLVETPTRLTLVKTYVRANKLCY